MAASFRSRRGKRIRAEGHEIAAEGVLLIRSDVDLHGLLALGSTEQHRRLRDAAGFRGLDLGNLPGKVGVPAEHLFQ